MAGPSSAKVRPSIIGPRDLAVTFFRDNKNSKDNTLCVQ